ncbi:MAG: hypothetical protein AAF512_08485 [Pseudomonadota bacterium]
MTAHEKQNAKSDIMSNQIHELLVNSSNAPATPKGIAEGVQVMKTQHSKKQSKRQANLPLVTARQQNSSKKGKRRGQGLPGNFQSQPRSVAKNYQKF